MSIATFSGIGRHGELGNQMFQVAAVIGYGRKHGKDVVFPDWTCKISGRNYLNVFEKSVNTDFPPGFSGSQNFQMIQYSGLKYIDLPVTEGNVDFIGYFQSEKYFENCKDEIRDLFRPNKGIRDYLENKYKDVIENPNKVSLHVRTAKRVGPDSPQAHAAASREFIEKAMKEFPDDATYVVFADVMSEATYMLPDGKKYVLVQNEENYIDLFLMTYFQNYIVSPSTFGWWGAWLSQSKDPKITVLKKWFREDGSLAHLNDNDVIPEKWIKIDV